MSSRYWRKRATKYESEWTKRCEETVEKRLARHYQKALSAIKEDILKLYATFAKDNGMDFDEARRVLSSREFREWRMSMLEYLQRIADGDKGLERELNTLAMRPRISRLEKLYGETLQELDNLGRNVNKSMKDFLSGAYTGNYYRNIFDFVKIGGMSVALAKIDNLSVEKVLAARWSGKNYSQRIWNNTKLLSGVVKDTIANGVHRGLSIPQMSRMIEDKMHAGYNNAVRLVRTEMNFVNNQAHYDSMVDAGIEAYEFIAVLDNRTTPMCRTRDGEVYLMEEKSVGFNYPPLHARCRSTVAPFIEGVSRKGARVARDKSGKNIDIPAAMKYKDYESVYIKKEKSLETWKNEQKAKSVPELPANQNNFRTNPQQTKGVNYSELNPQDFKAEIKALQKTYHFQQYNVNVSPEEADKTLHSTGKLIINEIRSKLPNHKFYDINALQHEVDIMRQNLDKVSALFLQDIISIDELLRETGIFKSYQDKLMQQILHNNKLEDDLKRLCAEQVKTTMSQVREMGATQQLLAKQFGKSNAPNRPIVEEALNYYPRDWIEKSVSKSGITIFGGNRGSYSFQGNILVTSGTGNEALCTAIHELGHRMEHVYPREIVNSEERFYLRRTAGERLEKLKDVCRDDGYSDNELTRKDKFLHPYMGKDTGVRAYELVSMGFEYAFTNPMYLMQDEDMAEWIFGLLALI